MSDDIVSKLGPLAALAGTWEGEGGADVAPSDDRGTETNAYRERLVLSPFGPVDNHEQKLWGLRYATTAWRLGEADAFHEETRSEERRVGKECRRLCRSRWSPYH
jgi:hypothetical protein